ncbi:MAG: hypothetical protein RLO50_14725 [Azospirillaceae bacterium]
MHLLLARVGIAMNQKKLRRLYLEEKLQVCRRGSRKRALRTRAPLSLPEGPTRHWSLNFGSDAFADGRRFRLLAVVDDFTRECLALHSTRQVDAKWLRGELQRTAPRRVP